MISLDDCGPGELRKLAPYATPRQIAEAKHRIAELEAGEAKARADAASREAVAAARRVRAWFGERGADDHYALLFTDAKLRAQASNVAFRAYVRLQRRADALKRAIDYRPTERAP